MEQTTMAKRKKFQAIKADTSDFKGIVHNGRRMKFDSKGTFVMDDEGLAREVESVYGKKGKKKLAIVPFDDHETRELGHTYTFGASKKFSDAWEAFEKRRKRRGKNANSSH